MNAWFKTAWLLAALLAFLAAPMQAQSGWGLAPDGRGGFVFCDLSRDEVWHLDAERHLVRLATQTHCHNLVPGYDGNVYGEDIGGESRAGGELSIWQLSPQGERSFVLAPTTEPDPSVWLVHDAAGNRYASNGNPHTQGVSQILKRTPEGQVSVLAGSTWGFQDGRGADARFGTIGGMAATRDGTLYVVDDGNLRRVAPDGTVATLARNIVTRNVGGLPFRGGLWNHSMGVAVAATGDVYIVDYSRQRIVRYRADGQVATFFQSSGLANTLTRGGWGWRPVGIAILGDDIFILEDWPLPRFASDLIAVPRLTRLRPDGHREKIAGVAGTPARTVAIALLAATGALAWRFTQSWRRTWARKGTS